MKKSLLFILLYAWMTTTSIAQCIRQDCQSHSNLQCTYTTSNLQTYVEKLDLKDNCISDKEPLFYRIVVSYQTSPTTFSELELLDQYGQPIGTPLPLLVVGGFVEATFLLPAPDELPCTQVFAHLTTYCFPKDPSLTYHCEVVSSPLE